MATPFAVRSSCRLKLKPALIIIAALISYAPTSCDASASVGGAPTTTSSSLSLPPSLASRSRRSLPLHAKLVRSRRNYFGSFGGGSSASGYARSFALDESDFESEDDDCSKCEDEQLNCNDSITTLLASTNSFRGGGAATSSPLSKVVIPGLRKQQQRQQNRRRQRMQQLQKLEGIKDQKLRQFRKVFRQKQRQFQESLYNLNSRFSYDFPRPPYTLWRLDPDMDAIGKTTLTGKIFLLNIAMFGIQTCMPQITALGAKRSDMIMEGRQLYRLLTPIFLHGGIGHLMANSYSLKSMGINVERAFGQPRMVAVYLVSGIMGNVMSAIQSPNPAVGASGAIFGLVGAYYTFLSRNQDLFGSTADMQKGALIETIGINLLLGQVNPMIDNWGHIGGFIGGVGMAWLIGPKLYVARIPLGEDSLAAGGFGAGKIVIDRPMLTFRAPEFVDEGMYRINDNVRKLGKRVTASARGLFNSGQQEYYLDKTMDYSMGSSLGNNSNGDGTIYRTLKGDIQLEGDVNVTPSDGFRQDVNQLPDPTKARQQRHMPRRRAHPRAGRSLRPRYGHLYR